jgi:rod shape-determining protein MreD
MQARALGTILLGSLLAAALQKESLVRLRVGNTKADLVIVFIGCCSIIWGVRGGLLSGAVAGVLQAVSQGAGMGGIIASRTLTGYAVARAGAALNPEQILMAAPVAFAATILCEFLYYLFNPWLAFAGWARVVAGEAVFNAGLALVMHWVLLHVGGRRRVE